MYSVRRKKISSIVSNLLKKADINKPSIDVELIAKLCNIEIRKRPFEKENEISGVLIRDTDKVLIGINSNHHIHRQRFTIAHEIGHFLLHEMDQVFIDNRYGIHFRNDKSSLGIDKKEIEANTFASMLLIPDEFLLKDLKVNKIDILEDRNKIINLAEKYDVSLQAMTLKLGRLLSV